MRTFLRLRATVHVIVADLGYMVDNIRRVWE